jgi:hypothetical protein
MNGTTEDHILDEMDQAEELKNYYPHSPEWLKKVSDIEDLVDAEYKEPLYEETFEEVNKRWHKNDISLSVTFDSGAHVEADYVGESF